MELKYRSFCVLIFLPILGCASMAQERYDAAREQAKLDYGSRMRLPDCLSDPARPMRSILLQHAKCGDPIYASEKAEWPHYSKVCRQEHKTAKDCLSDFRLMMTSRMKLRYTRADLSVISLKCQAHPTECSNLRNVEWWFADSHNDAVREAALDHMQEAEKQFLKEWEQEQARRRQIFDSIGTSSRSVNCTSIQSGDIVQTNCR